MNLHTLQQRLAAHHMDQFGHVPMSIRSNKVGEEAGEVQAAVVRHLSRRDGRKWTPEIEKEIGDTFIALVMLADKAGLDFESLVRSSCQSFLEREWVVDKWPAPREGDREI